MHSHRNYIHSQILILSHLFLIFITGCSATAPQKKCDLIAQSSINMHKNEEGVLSSINGNNINAILVDGEQAYVGFGNTIIILDITNPADPKPINSVSLPYGDVGGLQTIGKYLHVYSFSQIVAQNYYIFDVSNPMNPVEVSCKKEEEIFYMVGATLSGDYAYLPLGDEGQGGVRIYDVTNPSEMSLVGAYQPESMSRPRLLSLFAKRSLLDSSPRIVTSVGILGDYAYVGENLPGGDSIYNGQLRILNISAPENPELVGIYYMPYQTGITQVVTGDKYVFASASGWIVDQELTTLIDVSDPTSPIELHEFPKGRIATTFKDFVYFIDSGNIVIWDFSDPLSSTKTGSIVLPPSTYVGAEDIVPFGDYLYVAIQGVGLQIYNNMDPGQPKLIGSLP